MTVRNVLSHFRLLGIPCTTALPLFTAMLVLCSLDKIKVCGGCLKWHAAQSAREASEPLPSLSGKGLPSHDLRTYFLFLSIYFFL